ncbi:3'-5' exonuclease [Amycolatopsis bartoniae]|nr:3'-5' exonuclease [Amycolatopsis bartoniae]
MLQLSRDGRSAVDGLEFTAIDFETTALHPGHIIELAAVRTTADGTVLGELSTLVNPGPGIPSGPVRVHGITRRELDSAPTLPEAFAFFADLFSGSVLVAHNLAFEARFLRRELERYGLRLGALPGVCTLTTARSTLQLPNYRLATVSSSLGLTDFSAHTALGDARACAQVVTTLVRAHGLRLNEQPVFAPLPRLPKTRALTPRQVPTMSPVWTAELPERIAVTTTSADPVLEEAYLELLGNALADRHISADEGAALTRLAAEAGLTREDLHRIHTGFVQGMQAVAEADGILTTEEVADLRTVAAALDVPDLVAELRPTEQAERPTRVLVLGRGADADELRAAVLMQGLQLAKNLTASVTHLVACPDVPASETRLRRAAELRVPVLDSRTARARLGLAEPAAPVPPPRVPVPATAQMPATPAPPAVPAPRQGPAVWGGRVVTALGLVLVFVAAVAEFGGAPLSAGLMFFVLGTGIAIGGWYLGERWRVRSS